MKSIEEIIQYTKDDIINLTEQEKSELPTILDVLKYLERYEHPLCGDDWDKMFTSGYYLTCSNMAWTNKRVLMPCSRTTFVMMRGQNRYYPFCSPSLYRDANQCSMELEQLRITEFIRAVSEHPVMKEFYQNIEVDNMALAQHYGFRTNCLDVTNEKMVAAFFASTCYNANTDSYEPVDENYDEGIGVFYVSKESLMNLSFTSEKLRMVGNHYFARPTRQNAVVYVMSPKENFDDDDNFERIVFRHNKMANQSIYDSVMKRDIFPNDSVAKIARNIQNGGANVRLFEEQMMADWAEWENSGREYLKSHILTFPPIYRL